MQACTCPAKSEIVGASLQVIIQEYFKSDCNYRQHNLGCPVCADVLKDPRFMLVHISGLGYICATKAAHYNPMSLSMHGMPEPDCPYHMGLLKQKVDNLTKSPLECKKLPYKEPGHY